MLRPSFYRHVWNSPTDTTRILAKLHIRNFYLKFVDTLRFLSKPDENNSLVTSLYNRHKCNGHSLVSNHLNCDSKHTALDEMESSGCVFLYTKRGNSRHSAKRQFGLPSFIQTLFFYARWQGSWG